MALVKCPRCELNYMQATDKVCQVCRREMHGEDDHDNQELCANCGERLPLPREEFCAVCLKELSRGEDVSIDPEEVADETVLELPGASEMEEIEIDADDQPIPQGEFKVIKDELGADDEEEEDLEELGEEIEGEDEAYSSLEELSALELDEDEEDDE